MQDLLQSLRNQVNTIDEELVYMLFRRIEIVKEIQNLSKTEGIELDNDSRRQELLTIMLEEAKDKWVDPELVTRLHHLVQEHSDTISK